MIKTLKIISRGYKLVIKSRLYNDEHCSYLDISKLQERYSFLKKGSGKFTPRELCNILNYLHSYYVYELVYVDESVETGEL